MSQQIMVLQDGMLRVINGKLHGLLLMAYQFHSLKTSSNLMAIFGWQRLTESRSMTLQLCQLQITAKLTG